MFLEQVVIDNCKSLIHAEIDFRNLDQKIRKWSILVGENGTGKSTVLKAIGLLLAGSDAIPHIIGDPAQWVRMGAASCNLKAILRTKDGVERKVSLSFGPKHNPREILSLNAQSLEAIDSALSHAEQNYFIAAYGPYRRIADATSSFVSPTPNVGGSAAVNDRVGSLITMFDKNAPVNPLPSWAMDLEYERGEEGLAIVRDAMEALLPNLQFKRIDRSKKKLIFGTADGEVPLEELSDGYQNVAAWIGDLLHRVTRAFAHYKNPLEARGLLLIDEVDAHLHPTWQRRLRTYLDSRLPNFQSICTTHSPLTLQQFHEGEAYVLSRDDNKRVGLTPFETDPSKLLVHQLYDLAFKVNSLDSVEVEESKSKVRELRKKERLDPEEVATLAEAREVLGSAGEHQDPIDNALGNEALQTLFGKLDRLASDIEKKTQTGG
jgi:energy-coupling factor transporter ATP-binding protein EcfA2